MVDFKKLVGQAKDFAGKNEEKIESAIDKAAKLADEKTGGKHRDKISGGAEKLKDAIDKATPEEPAKGQADAGNAEGGR
ncbi:antitoxin [Patulibacter defluvii]|uniref:antitoxin n=1 Tax=Patulibacter defluvii TaxID=3095358 RepID=UPI002A754737|nr:antitoxin [Patulibacter sp. DM4]